MYEVIFTQRGCARSSDFGNSCDGVKSLSLSRPFAVQHCSICETNLCNGSEKLITFNWIAVHLSFIIYHWFSLQDDDLNNK